jgi:hypothetical protein
MLRGCALLFLIPLLLRPAAPTKTPDRVAERYVKLALAIGQYDADFVDAYYGPAEWKAEAVRARRGALPAAELQEEARSLLGRLERYRPAGPLEVRRLAFLKGQIKACLARVELLAGKKLTFDQESLALYGAMAPRRPEKGLPEKRAELEALLPGSGSLPERLARFRRRFVIPREKVEAIFAAAIAECRKRTLAMVRMPAGENFQTEFVTGAPWGAYNWYKGNFFSLIQVNTDLPVYIDGPLGLAAHEGYPGHHLYNLLLEERLLKGEKWIEYSIYPLYSPQSLIAEGTANYGVEVIFSGDERAEFEARTLYPLAGIDPGLAPERRRVQRLLLELGEAGTETARGYLDGRFNREQALARDMEFELSSPERAAQNLRFLEDRKSVV